MPKSKMTPEMLGLVAERFRALGEPARLQILDTLRRREMTVGELVEATGLTTANLSKHLQVLHAAGFVKRHKEGLYVYYLPADDEVYAICDLICGRVTSEVRERGRRLTAG